jgi:hypothetical protein
LVCLSIIDGIDTLKQKQRDLLLAIGNLLTPKKSLAKIVPEGHPGFEGKWPEYIPPKVGDSRCSCPGLNAMANHGE